MPFPSGFRRVFRLPWRSREQIGAEVDEELRFHLDMRVEELIRAGVPPEEARRRARGEFGDVDAARGSLRRQDEAQERTRRRSDRLDGVRGDLRFALRTLRRNPSFAGVAVLTLALGIGAVTGMFGVIDAVLLRPLPVRDEASVAVLWTGHPERGEMRVPVPYLELRDYGERTRAFEGVAGIDYSGGSPSLLTDGGEPVAMVAAWVTGDFFPLLGVSPHLGRVLLPEDDAVGAAPVLVLSHSFWRRHYGGDERVIGRSLRWNDRAYTVVGVMPRGFEYPTGAELWTPLLPAWPKALDPAARPNEAIYLNVVGRMRPGVALEGARADYDAFLRDTDPKRVEALRGLRAEGGLLRDLIVGEVRPALLILSAAVGLVLLIACVNVANLLLIRGSTRVQELAIRAAVGAGRGRVIRQLLTESAVLATLGGVLGVLIAGWAVRGFVALAPPGLPRLEAVGIDGRVLAFAAAVTGATALLAGLAPALWSAATDLSRSLRSGARVGSGSARTRRVRQALVVGQVALALLVLVGAGLLLRSLLRLQSVDMGFSRERLVIVQPAVPPARYPDRPAQLALREEMLSRVRALPGVASATTVPVRPFSGPGGWDAMYTGDGQTAEEQAKNPWLNMEIVGGDYFQTLRIPVLRGRALAESDRQDSEPVVVVSETVARLTWPGEDPLGKRIKLGDVSSPAPWHTVVGVVGETRYRELVVPRPTFYLPVRQFMGPVPTTLAIQTRGDTAAVIPAVRAALRELDPELRVASASTLSQLLSGPLARPRFSAVLLAGFATVALLLSAVGIYGVMAAFVRQRTHEIGVRMALGARTGDVRRLVLRQGLVLAGVGAAVGLMGALPGARAMSSALFEVRPTDPVTLVGVTGLLLAVAALACWLPARRATRVDPMVVLRSD